jgi:predicted site-specific integrase-resolvase
MPREHREVPVKRASKKAQSRRVFGHPGKPSRTAPRAALYARVSSHDQQKQMLPCRTRLTHHNTSCTSCQMRKGNNRFH